MAIITQGHRLSNLPRYTPVDPSLVAFNPSAATSGIMDALRVGATLEKIKADRAAAEELAATRDARIAYENATKGAATRVAPRKADLELATIGLEEGALGKRYKAEDMDLLNKIAAGERLFQRQDRVGMLEGLTLDDQIRRIQGAPSREALAENEALVKIRLMESEIEKNRAAAAAAGAKEPKLSPDQEAYLKGLGELSIASGIPPEQLKELIASGAKDTDGIPYAAALYKFMKRQAPGLMGGALEPYPGGPVVGGQPAVTADGITAPAATPTAPAGRAVFQLDKSGNVKRVDKPATAPAAVVQPAAQEKPAGSIAKPEGEKTTSTARPQMAQEAAHGDLGKLSPVTTPVRKSDNTLSAIGSIALPAASAYAIKHPNVSIPKIDLRHLGGEISRISRQIGRSPVMKMPKVGGAAGTAALAFQGGNWLGGKVLDLLADKRMLEMVGGRGGDVFDWAAAGESAPTTQEAVSQEQFDRITKTISDIVAKIEQIRGLEGVDEMTKVEAVAELTRQGQALAARRNSLLSSI